MTESSISASELEGREEVRNGSELEASLQRRNMELEAENMELREQLAQSRGPVIKCGYLYKHRPYSRYFSKPWELRFFSLTRSSLTFWKTENEASSNPIGERHIVDGWLIHMESLRDGKFVTFSIENGSGAIFLRLSEGQDGERGQSWVNAFKSIGCRVVTYVDEEHDSVSNNQSKAEGEVTSSIKEVAVENNDSVNSTSELHQRKPKLSSGASAGNTVLLQEGISKTADDKKHKDGSQTDASVQYTLRPSSPAHKKLRDSPLSSDEIFTQSHAGLFNLCIVCLVAVNGRLIIENLMKYGLLIQTGFWFSSKSLKDWPLLMCGLSLPLLPLCALMVERLSVRYSVSERVMFVLHTIIISVSILYPSYIIQRYDMSSLLSGFILIMFSIVAWMKLISYAHTNADARALSKKGEKVEKPNDSISVEYPDNITVSDITYFMVAPTLCYQIGYPRRDIIRKGWVLRQSVKLLVFTGLMGFIVEQYINPTIKNSEHPLKGSYLKALERILKLSIPTLYVWLCLFYCFFHLWLNILAELTRFGDREFYKDWWNAKTVEEYWRMWNMPVHKWMVRHIYFPCLRAGLPKHCAFFLVFALSGVFHEVCVGIPCHMVRCWAFLGIMFQVPLVFLTNYLQSRFKNLMVGNMVFWFFFCIVGQPMCVLLYYHDVVNQQQPTSTIRFPHTEL
ncbi:diacylglycerol O-acyltransferase 1 [Marchantia polymorpha subsp. ruderalis]|uniref:O-acyltransferase n=1 Tax=Marchantia polymorpha TaxID=3197 RepID=A0A2R6XJ82_MARPO|nr:hypothetical protein MARPO_0012s0121 [Marchantia polymorpha]BBN18538.1 hypothetical protein Mp_8g03300 [Marchantia polymorpha subsp. ruderalis]PTQ46181.1 hypothetical protein MARPO_0012s0121 [Marchantia polymorpha]PTQ46182.1 hypothetical protein MARPO_0012s0121 [Marchantia polymorpha]BBN18539.1 hypothetical protein Mp_8g03300 [Marchantia polymorpha subsp. ruderalis]|eukprot:PTQ46180.1 hypothetical protein MARPO_0012s0121 [Marchantia polymorpha]